MTDKQTKKQTKMPKHLKEWLVKQFKNVEDGKLTEQQFTDFIEHIEQHKDNPFIQECFKTHLRRTQTRN